MGQPVPRIFYRMLKYPVQNQQIFQNGGGRRSTVRSLFAGGGWHAILLLQRCFRKRDFETGFIGVRAGSVEAPEQIRPQEKRAGARRRVLFSDVQSKARFLVPPHCIKSGCDMTIRDNQMNSRRFELDETRRKLRDLNELRRHIETSLDRLGESANAVGGVVAGRGAENGAGEERRATLMRSLEEIDRNIAETRKELSDGQEELDHEEMVRNEYDRVPVAVGSRRGRSQVEHIRIVRSQRDDG